MTEKSKSDAENGSQNGLDTDANLPQPVSRTASSDRSTAFRVSTSRSSQRRVPTINFHNDYAAHVDASETETTEPEDNRQFKEDRSEHGLNQDDHPHGKVEKLDSRSSDDNPRPNEDIDLESGPPSLNRRTTVKSTRSAKRQASQDPNLVSWSGPDDLENPKNWPLKKKWGAVAIVSAFTFISPLASSMVAPALPAISADLNVTDPVLSQMSLSIFVLAYAFGPLFLAPLSELYGRLPILQLANLVFLVFNLGCGFAQNATQLLACRFFAGLGGSAPLAVGGGVLGDCFTADKRGQAVSLYTLMPILGPAIGPIAGGFIAQYPTWMWAFWSVSIADAVIQGFGLLFLQETWAPKLLAQKARRLRKQTANDGLYPVTSNMQITFGKKMRQSLARPFVLFFTQPIIVVLWIYKAYLYGLTYLVISTFPALFTSPMYYDRRTSIGGLHFIALAIGYLLGSQLTAYFNDWMYARLKKRNGGVGKPEFRVRLQ